MKRIIPLIMLLALSATTSAQLFKKRIKHIEPQYQTGMVTLDSLNRVNFSEIIEVPGMSESEIMERVNRWFEERFKEPVIIGKKVYESESPNTLEAKIEEYLVFKNKFLVLDRTRIYYFLTIKATAGKCSFSMSRITYWYDDEDPKGGLKMRAEDWITDENAFSKDKKSLQRFEGKFRIKTIDLKNLLIDELKKELSEK